MNAMLRAELDCSTAQAASWRSLGRAVDRVDGLGEAWSQGRFGSCQAKQFARLAGNRRVRDVLPSFASQLVEHAEVLDFDQFALVVKHFESQADVDGAHDDRDDAIAHRNAHVSSVGDGVAITASGGDPLQAAEFRQIFDRFVDAEFRADVDARAAEHGSNAALADLPRTDRQRRFDALVAIFRAAAGADGPGQPADLVVDIVVDADTWAQTFHQAGLAAARTLDGVAVDPFTGMTRPDELLVELLADPAGLASRQCETSNGIRVHPHDVLRAALSGHVRRVVVDAKGTVIDHGRKHRLFTGPARAAAKILLKRCEHPGCRLPVEHCQVDHAHEHANGGETNQSNSRIRCGPHNVDKSVHRWRSRRATNGRTYTVKQDGTVMLPVGVRQPDFTTQSSAHMSGPHVYIDITTVEQAVAHIRNERTQPV